MRSYIDKRAAITKIGCKINSNMQYYSGQTGSIKGVKKIKNYTLIYLIEFFDDNRIWSTKKEFQVF